MKPTYVTRAAGWIGTYLLCSTIASVAVAATGATDRHAVPRDHPRLLGSRAQLQQLAHDRADAFQRVVRVARQQQADPYAKMISLALVCAIQQDAELGKQAVIMAMKTVNGPIKKGHIPFGHDLARVPLSTTCAMNIGRRRNALRFTPT